MHKNSQSYVLLTRYNFYLLLTITNDTSVQWMSWYNFCCNHNVESALFVNLLFFPKLFKPSFTSYPTEPLNISPFGETGNFKNLKLQEKILILNPSSIKRKDILVHLCNGLNIPINGPSCTALFSIFEKLFNKLMKSIEQSYKFHMFQFTM